MVISIGGVEVYGVDVDHETRCKHYHSDMDIIAMRFACCDRFYPCFECHREMADHVAALWPMSRFSEFAVLCGACGGKLSVTDYLASNHLCPFCSAQFNPGCLTHRGQYFETLG